MLENINYALFALINATPASSWWAIEVATFIAKDLIIIVPLLVVALWLWGPNQRQLVFKVMLALALSLSISWVIGHLFPHDRPFVDGVGYNFLHHAADDSFPSDHGTVIFTFALAFLFWHRVCCWSSLRRLHGHASIWEYTGRWICWAGCWPACAAALARNCCGRAAVMASTNGCSACIVSASRCRFVKAGYAANV